MVTKSPRSPAAGRSRRPAEDAPRETHGGDDGSELLRGLKAAWHRIERGVPELKDDLLCYATVQKDRARLAVTRTAASFARAAAIGLVALVVVVAATVLTIDGIAGGIAVALDGRTWLANLITGGGILALIVAVVMVRQRAQRSARMNALARRYARHDARQRAMEARSAAS